MFQREILQMFEESVSASIPQHWAAGNPLLYEVEGSPSPRLT